MLAMCHNATIRDGVTRGATGWRRPCVIWSKLYRGFERIRTFWGSRRIDAWGWCVHSGLSAGTNHVDIFEHLSCSLDRSRHN